MPVMDGFEATSQIRKFLLNKHHQNRTVIAALTAYSNEVFQQKAKKAGMDLFMTKPIDIQQFI